MSKVLVAYSTHEGQTAKIADFIAGVLRGRGLDVDTCDVKESADPALIDYDGVIVGGSVHVGKHDKHVVDYVRGNRHALTGLPSAFFSVSLSSASGDTQEAEGYVEKFEEETGWLPTRIALFGGGLPYKHLNFVSRHMMKRIVEGKPGNLGTDLSRDYVYTEWDGVRRFAEDFAAELEAAPR
ncbi:flavodoxin domain-containing protein [Sinomonas atrocyanea]|jgi:menaquinone-dependent protoporphyrinogen oxidase|uniref:flavodoxin domain-containing protein n=1 Tax=Sinomonas atrocyanea TaxID=37927 RepID=UPI002787B27B|nr:flavodoxin domain-containing protein [Sinomonas atrocyanea]MDQ0260408.1 menaquinone-dependent protoporphyrinogen oxidase [Sinomonas atrocyanea]MDR6622364.1 menaquinone-dependent protoporphyrinogen oxidase [Sinomonas atrocyanea]